MATKKALNIEQQIARLKERGMQFDNEEKAKEILLDVGYYRLGFYSFPFEQSFPHLDHRNHKYVLGTTFQSVYDLYEFDTKLRRILLHALDRIEVNIRTQLTYIVSNHYRNKPTWFVDPAIVTSDFIAKFDEKVYKTISDNPVIKRHHHKYPNDKYAPAWKTIEFMTLGNITTLFLALKDKQLKKRIASQYGCSFGVFINYLETIRVMRNNCAHGGCIYNLRLAKGVKGNPAGVPEDSRHNINGAIKVIAYILGKISSDRKNDLINEIKELVQESRSEKTNEIIKLCTKISV